MDLNEYEYELNFELVHLKCKLAQYCSTLNFSQDIYFQFHCLIDFIYLEM